MKRKNFENIGKVAVKDIVLCDTRIGLYVPLEKMSANVKAVYERFEEYFEEGLKRTCPNVDLNDYTLYRDISLHMDIDSMEVEYSISIIMWIQDENQKAIYEEFFDPFKIEINDEDNKYLKKLVMQKLVECFF